jgi:hypothetical protein
LFTRDTLSNVLHMCLQYILVKFTIFYYFYNVTLETHLFILKNTLLLKIVTLLYNWPYIYYSGLRATFYSLIPWLTQTWVQPLVMTILLSTFLNLSAFQFHMQVRSWNICHCVPSFFHLTWCLPVSWMLSQITEFPIF